MKTFRVLTVCGTGIATSTVAAEKCKEFLTKRGLSVEVVECKAVEVSGKIPVYNPHVVVATTPINDSALHGVKKFVGLPFLIGVGMDKLADEIADYLRSLG
ncbi:PTS sugar transporter subunit IIB [Propionispora hippei]|uniref:PTS system, galactitol-specific IIB component n=1 Tax=Propionispora hippei DSM 15287 TaxID=1123003 RepID=A0A1M6J1P5_9FIRM|nr:PTS sugar transporter subunit IIB [Propionispora hippei]SHJ40521.1 PTS system, galactitol-specific IIB component [Propionispora hippei DSM 15287]